MSILTETAPRTIWLCVSDDEDDYELPYPELYAEDAEITWSTDQPVAVTVEYERKDIADNARIENEQLQADLETAQKERDDALAAVDANWVTHQQIVAMRADLAAARAERDVAVQTVGKVQSERDNALSDLAAARALLKRQPPSDCRPCHECGAIWWSDEHGCWFVGGQRERTALAGKDAT